MTKIPIPTKIILLSFTLMAIGMGTSEGKAQLKYGVELIKNGDFEGGNANGWTNGQRNPPVVDFYGNPKTTFGPSFQEAQKMKGPAGWGGRSGGQYYLRNALLRQTFSLVGNATDVDAGRLSVRLEGYLGGWKTNGYALFRATFSDANKRKLASWEIGSDTHQSKRNYITKLLLRRKVFPVPPSSRTMVIEAVCQASDRFMDNLSCKLLLDWKLSSLPLGSNLIVNGSFETKELTGQPWEGWELFGVTDVGLYGTPKYPGLNYLFAMRKAKKDPGNYLCRTGNWVSQTFDLRGNSTQVDSGQYEFILKARTLSTNNTSGEFVVEFFNSLGAKIQSKSFRTWEYWRTSLRPILLPWSRRILIPPFSRKVVLTFKDRGAFQWLDEVSLFLGKTVNPPATPLGVNLIRGSDFEASDWLDFTSDTMEGAWVSGGSPPYLNPILGKYGTSPFPSLAHAKNILGGRQLLRTNGGNPGRPITGSGIESDFYLNGRNLLIDNGLLRIHFEGYFGGFGSQYASNSLRVTFFDQFQRKLGSVTTAPVTNKERGNKTVLLFRSKDVAVPIGTRRVLVQWEIRTATSYPLALADNLKVLFFDSRKGKFNYPGSGKDLTLFTGVDRLPTGGVGFDVKKAQGGKVLNVRIKSVKGTYNKEVILLLGQLFPTSKPPKPLFPPLAVGAGFGFILNGYANGGPLGPIRLLPNGSDFGFLLPPFKTGMSLLLQGGVFTTKASPVPIVMTNGHEIQF